MNTIEKWERFTIEGDSQSVQISKILNMLKVITARYKNYVNGTVNIPDDELNFYINCKNDYENMLYITQC